MIHFTSFQHPETRNECQWKRWKNNRLGIQPTKLTSIQKHGISVRISATKGENFSTVDENVGFKKQTNSGWPGNDDSYDSRALFAARLKQQKWWFIWSVGKVEISKHRDSGGMTPLAEWWYCNWYTCRFFLAKVIPNGWWWLQSLTIIDKHWQTLIIIDNHWQSLIIIDKH